MSGRCQHEVAAIGGVDVGDDDSGDRSGRKSAWQVEKSKEAQEEE